MSNTLDNSMIDTRGRGSSRSGLDDNKVRRRSRRTTKTESVEINIRIGKRKDSTKG